MLAFGTDVAVGGSIIDEAILEVGSLDASVVALRHDQHVTAAFAAFQVCCGVVPAVC